MVSIYRIWHSIRDELGYDLAKVLFGNALKAVFKKAVEKGKEQVGIAVEETFKRGAEYRNEFVGEVMLLDPPERDPWARRIRLRKMQLPRTYGENKPYSWYEENKLFARMGDFRKSVLEEAGEDSRVAKDNRKEEWHEILCAMAHFTDVEFDMYIEALTHDVARQFMRMLWAEIRARAPQLFASINDGAGRIADELETFNDRLDNSAFAHASRAGGLLGMILDPFGTFRR